MFSNFNDFITKKERIAIVGLGYVGLPLAVFLDRWYRVTGFDENRNRITELKNNYDKTGEITPEQLIQSGIEFTTDPQKLRQARLIISTVPTPTDSNRLPNLNPVKKATATIGRNLSRGTIVVYESTVYPGVTEEICIPILEEQSGLQCGIDFKVGYSPERINPGDREHSLDKIIKIVAGQDKQTAELLARIYGTVVKAGIYITPDIRTAEAAKVIENIQRDLNIALVNELALIFNRLNIDTREVLKAAATKWNFISFEPGLVGGHCIGVDPYYLTYKAEQTGYHPVVISAARRINHQMGKYIAEQTVRKLINAGKAVHGSRVLILGFTFKENIKDTRNTRIVDIYHELRDYGAQPYIYDPLAPAGTVKHDYGIDLIPGPEAFRPYDAVILAVRHKNFLQLELSYLRAITGENPVLMDIKAGFDQKEAENAGFIYWRL